MKSLFNNNVKSFLSINDFKDLFKNNIRDLLDVEISEDNKENNNYEAPKAEVKNIKINSAGIYTYSYCNKSIYDRESALKVMSPKLNEMTFAMRTGEYKDANLLFKFGEVTYSFSWNKDADEFVGIAESSGISSSVIWNEINNAIESDEIHKANDSSVNDGKKEKAEETNPEECKYKDNLFYPYGETCKNCKNKLKCFSDETLENAAKPVDASSYTYDLYGNPIDESEIPSLKDYTNKENDYDVDTENDYDVNTENDYDVDTEVADDENIDECDIDDCNITIENDEECPVEDNTTSECKLDMTLTGRSLYDKLNKEFSSKESVMISYILNAIEKILLNDMYDVEIRSDETDISTIYFSMGLVKAHMKIELTSNIYEVVHMHHLKDAIKKKFKFANVTFANDKIYCDLI